MNANILLVEDEDALVMTLGDRLRKEGYKVEIASDGQEGSAKAIQTPFDLILLDLMLPRKNGMEVCREIRSAGIITPVLMLTALGQTSDKVAGLKIGADDYVTKPFEMAELMARIEALLRRRGPQRATATAPANNDSYWFGSVQVDFRGTTVTRGGKLVNLSAREYQLLHYFIEHRGTTLTRHELLCQVWGYNADTFTRTVDVHVASLRQKLESDPKQPEHILTVQGLGYKFVS